MKFQSAIFALAALAGVVNAAALAENASGTEPTSDQSGLPSNGTMIETSPDGTGVSDVKYLANVEITTFSGKHCNGDNQGTTRIDQTTRACIRSSNAGSYHIQALTNGFHTVPPCKKVQVKLKNKDHCNGEKSYFIDVQKTNDCYHFYGPAKHTSFWAKCVAV